MNDRSDDIIEAQPAPLSHLSKEQKKRVGSWLDWRSLTMALAVIGVVIFAFVWATSDWQTRPATQQSIETSQAAQSDATQSGETSAVDPSNSTAGRSANNLPPFAQTQRERARTQAQDALAKFVELQIELEENMQVESWGQAELDAAMDMAQQGDEAFLAGRFDDALADYENAADQLSNIIAKGNQLFSQQLADGRQFIAALSHEEAKSAIEAALVIKPDHKDAQQALARAEQIPSIVAKLRTAKNHELGRRYAQALQVYQEIEQLDPLTPNLQALKQAAAQAQAGNNLTSYISQGFAHLERKQFDAAKKAFRQALALDPTNAIAQGGLEQVAQQNDLAKIQSLRKQAEAHVSEENWDAAINSYNDVLQLDGNIQFAVNGLSSAKAHQRAQTILNRIIEAPQKLSSEKLYIDAVAVVTEAKDLSDAGARLQTSIAEVEQLLKLYRDPVDVVLLSDNATNVIMSNVGQLGYFERKTLTLRPGEYTIRGSQDGCRDIFLNIEVLPGIAPVDLSCAEPLTN